MSTVLAATGQSALTQATLAGSDIAAGQLLTEQTALLALVPIAPLVGALFLALFMLRVSPERQWQAGWVATIFSFTSFLISLALFTTVGSAVSAVEFFGWTWFAVDQLKVDFALRMDELAGVMTLVVTGVGTLIHLYAIGYMEHDDNRPRFFCYLNLFLFSMLLLVLGDNLLVMFVGWEGVGLCSYLLIGFWYREMPNAIAGQKAFVVNRIGDAGFLLGIFLLFWNLGTVNFSELQEASGNLSPMLFEIAALLLFIGAVGKSAQIPLFVWLPDAMAGPTPVSALIHAATMVTAGVYMITRMSFLYIHAPVVLVVISVVGAITAFVAASIALVQYDIKKVLAYSTVSQLGYMFMALGAGAFSNGIYHVVTHAFFKALLFMCAGSVIVGCHHMQDMRQYGGLWKKMPITFVTYLVATYAIAGLPFGSGFFSKDAVLWAVYSNPGLASQWTLGGVPLSQILWAVGFATALLTAFYMTRSLVMTFAGRYRGSEHPHESPWVMTLPLAILAVPSLLFAFIYGESLLQFIAPWARPDMLADHSNNDLYHLLEYLSIGAAILGTAAAAAAYMLPQGSKVVGFFFGLWPALTRFLQDKWRFDELYAAIVTKPLRLASQILFSVVDRNIIDASVNGTGIFVAANGEIVRRMHSGRLSSYVLVMFFGTLAMLIFWLVL